LNPRLFEAYFFYARNRFAAGDLAKAKELFSKASEVNPEDYQVPALLVVTLKGLGEKEEARAVSEKVVELVKSHLQRRPNDVRAIYLGGGSLAELGRKEEALEWADRALQMDPEDPAVLYNVACLYTTIREYDDAFGLLEKSVEFGFSDKRWLENDSDLDPLRNDPRFKELLAQME
jgi:tetratricopeptide (TPR) repeat protein